MASKELTWTNLRKQLSHHEFLRLGDIINELISAAIAQGGTSEDISLQQTTRAVRGLCNNRALGGDFRAPLELKALSESRLQCFTATLNLAERTMSRHCRPSFP